MKKITVLQLIAGICLLIGNIIYLLKQRIEIPLALYICAGPLFLIAFILYIIAIVKLIKTTKQDKKE